MQTSICLPNPEPSLSFTTSTFPSLSAKYLSSHILAHEYELQALSVRKPQTIVPSHSSL